MPQGEISTGVPILHLACLDKHAGKALPNTTFMCILQEGEAQNLLVIDELLHRILRGISSKYLPFPVKDCLT